MSVDGRVQETTTKSRSGRRAVPLLSDAGVAALLSGSYGKSWQLRQTREREAAQGPGRPRARVHNGNGRALDPACVTRLFRKLSGGSPRLTFHGLRHSAAG